jgi:hypothetical protein
MYLLNGIVIFSSYAQATLQFKYQKHSLNHFVEGMSKLRYGETCVIILVVQAARILLEIWRDDITLEIHVRVRTGQEPAQDEK